MKTLKLGSLFDGSGTCPLAATMCEIEPVWASEIEKFPILVTSTRFPGMKHLGNIGEINGAEIEPVDIITFGSPCQDLSIAGKQKGLVEGERSNLFFEAMRIIREMRVEIDGAYPTFAIWENVPGAYSSNKGEDFKAVLEAFCAEGGYREPIPEPERVKGAIKWRNAGAIVGEGFSIAWRTLDAQYWGVPQRRRRIFLVADFGGERAEEVLFERGGLQGDTPPCGEAGQGVASHVEGGIGGSAGVGGCLTFKERAGCAGGGKGILCQADMSATLATSADQAVVHAATTVGGFIGRAGAKAGGIGYSEQNAPTIKANMETHVVIALQGNGIDQADTAGYNGAGDACHCLAVGQHVPLLVERRDATAFGISSYESNSMKSSNPHSGIYEADTSRTIDVSGGNPACNQGGIVIVEKQDAIAFEPGIAKRLGGHCYEDVSGTLRAEAGDNQMAVAIDCRNHGASDVSGTLQAKSTGGHSLNYQNPVCYAVKPSRNMMKVCENQAAPLMEMDYKEPRAVCYDIGNGQANQITMSEQSGALNCMHDTRAILHTGDADLVAELWNTSTSEKRRKYIVRRLTTLECGRLMGFPDWWCDDIAIASPTEADIAKWLEIFETHRKIMGKSKKPTTRNKVIRWLRNPRADSAEYKMWGNGIALPCVLYVMQGVKLALTAEG